MRIPSILFALTLTTLAAHADNAAVLAIFDKHCASCHDDEKPTLSGSINLASLLGSADDVKAILDRTGRADDAKGRMPKSKGKLGEPGYLPPLSAEQVATLQTWARGEAPVAVAARAFFPMRDEVKAVAADVLALDRAVQPTTRYITLTNLHNLRDAAGKTTESD